MQPGHPVEVDLAVPASQRTLVDASGRRLVEPGAFELRVGRSSRRSDQLAAGFRIVGDGESAGVTAPRD